MPQLPVPKSPVYRGFCDLAKRRRLWHDGIAGTRFIHHAGAVIVLTAILVVLPPGAYTLSVDGFSGAAGSCTLQLDCVLDNTAHSFLPLGVKEYAP